jgi:hypothetical protein
VTPDLTSAKGLRFGDVPVKALYAGGTKVWPAAPPAFSPANIAGLAIWLDAADYTPGSWPNKGAGPAASIVGSPPMAISQNTKNGLPLVRFNANEGRLRMTGTGVKWEHTLVYVGRMVGPNPGRIVTAAYPQPNFLIGFWNGFEDVAYSTTGAFFVPDQRKSWTTGWKLYSSDADASPEFGGAGYHPRMLKDGVLLSSGGQGDGYCQLADAWWDTFNISGYSPTGAEETCDCEVAEVVLYGRKLPDADREQVEQYLRGRWGL